MTTATPRTQPVRAKLAAAAAAAALLTTAALALAGAASASAAPARASSTALQAALDRDLSHYLTTRRTAEHISADSLQVTFPGTRPAISLATGTTRYDGGPPVSARALWQIGSNTKAFTAVILLQLEAEGKLSINDPIGKWLPQYPAWRHITIRQLLDMTSRIPDYLYQPAFIAAFAANQRTRPPARLVSSAAGMPLGPARMALHQHRLPPRPMIFRRSPTTPADQLAKRVITPLGLHPPSPPRTPPPVRRPPRNTRPGTSTSPAPRLVVRRAHAPPRPAWARPPAESSARWPAWPPGTAPSTPGGSADRPEAQLESLVSEATGKPIRRTTAADPAGYGLGVQQGFNPQTGIIWDYEGQAFGARVLHLYIPRTGLLIAVAPTAAPPTTTSPTSPERSTRPCKKLRSPHRLKCGGSRIPARIGPSGRYSAGSPRPAGRFSGKDRTWPMAGSGCWTPGQWAASTQGCGQRCSGCCAACHGASTGSAEPSKPDGSASTSASSPTSPAAVTTPACCTRSSSPPWPPPPALWPYSCSACTGGRPSPRP